MTITTPFLFLRHGETAWNREGRVQGQHAAPLNDTGRAQAVAAAAALSGRRIDRIVSRPLSRVRDTAAAIVAQRGTEISFDPDLMEAHLGAHQTTMQNGFLDAYWRGEYDPPGGETFADFTERVWAAMTRAVALGPNTLIVAHGGLWRAAKAKVRIEPDFRMPNAIPIAVRPGETGWRVDPLLPIPPEALASSQGNDGGGGAV
ncbi:MAG: histidine phosphatase family protein [Neomegalonema sp.]